MTKFASITGGAVLAGLLFAPPLRSQNVNVGTNIPPMSRGPGISKVPSSQGQAKVEEPALASALAAWQSKADAMSQSAPIWNAIAAQTKVPAKTLQRQRSSTRWTYGELLVANFLAGGSGNSFEKIVALRAGTNGWSQLARKLKIDPAAVAARVHAAAVSLQ